MDLKRNKEELGVSLTGRAICSNLFIVPQKRIYSSIPNAKLTTKHENF
jgi:hypothetical protein